MKYLLSCLFLTLAFSTSAHAASCVNQIKNISGIDELTKQSMIVECEQTKLNAKTAAATPTVTTEERIEMAEKWANVAKQFVGAMALVADEMGKTVNEFLPTPAGMLTAALITWQVMGDSISSAIGNVLQATVAIFSIILVSVYCKNLRHCETKEVTLKTITGEKIKKHKIYTPVSLLGGDASRWYHTVYIIGTLVGVALLYFAF